MKSIITTTLKALSIVVLAGAANMAWADLAGNVVRVNGEATAKDASGKSRHLSAGSAVNEGDAINTTQGSAIQIQMKDGALIAVTGDSTLKVKVYNFEEANGDANKVQLELVKGRFRTITGDAPKDTYNLSTPAAIVGIKGTTFDVLAGSDTTTILRDGSVTVETSCNGKGTGSIQLLDVPGTAVAISAPCKDPKQIDGTFDVADLDTILPLPGKKPTPPPAPSPSGPTPLSGTPTSP